MLHISLYTYKVLNIYINGQIKNYLNNTFHLCNIFSPNRQHQGNLTPRLFPTWVLWNTGMEVYVPCTKSFVDKYILLVC